MAGEVKVSASSFDYLLLGIVSCAMEGGTSMTNASLEAIGVRIGEKLVERATRPMPRGDKSDDKSGSSSERGRFASHVDAIRFVCREVWKLATRKSVDGLSVTKRGEWLVHDNNFSWISHVSKPHNTTGLIDFPPLGKLQPKSVAPAAAAASASASGSEKKDATPQQSSSDVNAPYLMVFMGLLKGALANLGLTVTVNVRAVQGQSVTFTIKNADASDGAAAASSSSETFMRP